MRDAESAPMHAGISSAKFDALSRLVQVSLVMNSTLTLKPLLQYIMNSATEITVAEGASILLVDRNTNELRFAAATGPSAERLIGMVVPMEGSIAGTIARENRAIVIDDTSTSSGHFKGIDQKGSFQTESILGVPMRIKDRLIGVLEVVNKREGRFDDDDVRHITILSSQAAVAIENAQLLAELRDANEDLMKVNQLKNDFISIASHELRTPLGVILGYASFLKEEAQGEASEHAQMVLNSALHLRNLIDDMTNLRYVQVKESELLLRDVRLSVILGTVQTEMETLAESKEQVLIFEPYNPSLTVHADSRLVAMALANIVNNAIKFTEPKGVIVVSVEARPNEIWISVKDTGEGIPAEQLDRIFDQFYQVEDPMTRRHNGMGLGLTISRAIIVRHGGRIWAESPGVGHGATVRVVLPVAGAPVATGPLIRGTGKLP